MSKFSLKSLLLKEEKINYFYLISLIPFCLFFILFFFVKTSAVSATGNILQSNSLLSYMFSGTRIVGGVLFILLAIACLSLNVLEATSYKLRKALSIKLSLFLSELSLFYVIIGSWIGLDYVEFANYVTYTDIITSPAGTACGIFLLIFGIYSTLSFVYKFDIWNRKFVKPKPLIAEEQREEYIKHLNEEEAKRKALSNTNEKPLEESNGSSNDVEIVSVNDSKEDESEAQFLDLDDLDF